MSTLKKLWEKPSTEIIIIRKAGSKKYIRREGGPGNYRYVYSEPSEHTDHTDSSEKEDGPVRPHSTKPEGVKPAKQAVPHGIVGVPKFGSK